MKNKTSKPRIFIGRPGTGKTFNSIIEMGKREYIICYGNDIPIDDIFSFPRDMGIIIEDLHETKLEKDKILDIIFSGRHVALTSNNKKDVPKSILNICQVKYPGKYDRRQVKIKLMAKNADEVCSYEKGIYDISYQWLKTRNRGDYYKLLEYNNPPPMQLISWLIASEPNNERLTFASSVMYRWPVKYLYALVAFSRDGKSGMITPPKRSKSNPLNYICKRLGLKDTEVYLLRHLLRDEKYKIYARKTLTKEECKVIGLKKPTRKKESKRKVKSLEDF